jgi:pyruvate/2-oxoglutarate dehydrogenase complex dihydrolipoamide acyltransferase (E2) component
VCIIVESQDEVAAFKNFVDDGAAAPAAKPAAPAAAAAPASPPPPTPVAVPIAAAPASIPASQSGGQILASPLARKLAAEQGLDLSVSLPIYFYCPTRIQFLNIADDRPRFRCVWFDHHGRPLSGFCR